MRHQIRQQHGGGEKQGHVVQDKMRFDHSNDFYDKVDYDGKKILSFLCNCSVGFQKENSPFSHIHGKPETAL